MLAEWVAVCMASLLGNRAKQQAACSSWVRLISPAHGPAEEASSSILQVLACCKNPG